MRAIIVVFTILALFGRTTAPACTTFLLEGKDRIYFGRNLDWDWEDGLVIVNPRNETKTSLVIVPGNKPAKWTSKYGSVTFNQFGQEMPFGGMNESGLVVENMWLNETDYAKTDSRPAVNLLQWIQYQLDNCGTVAEVLATDETLRIEPPPPTAAALARVHYLVCDTNGDCAVIEFLDGKMVAHRGKNLPCRALANNTYEDSIKYAKAHPEPKNAKGQSSKESLARFTRAANRVSSFEAKTPKGDVQYAFDTLKQVAQGDYTVWSMVYDVRGKQIHYRTRSNPEVRTVTLAGMDFSCARPVKFTDIQSKASAARGLSFEDLSGQRHRQYLQRFYSLDTIKQSMGDLTPLMEGLLMTIQSYHCGDVNSAAR